MLCHLSCSKQEIEYSYLFKKWHIVKSTYKKAGIIYTQDTIYYKSQHYWQFTKNDTMVLNDFTGKFVIPYVLDINVNSITLQSNISEAYNKTFAIHELNTSQLRLYTFYFGVEETYYFVPY